MSRIIAGDAGSIRLKPAAASTRPTSDRVKESLFGQLENLGQLDGASVLDLFAGTGALGLEALSRGANHAVLVERDRKAHEISLENSKSVISAIQKSRSDASVENKKADAEKFLKTNKQSFDLVFLGEKSFALASALCIRQLFYSLFKTACQQHGACHQYLD